MYDESCNLNFKLYDNCQSVSWSNCSFISTNLRLVPLRKLEKTVIPPMYHNTVTSDAINNVHQLVCVDSNTATQTDVMCQQSINNHKGTLLFTTPSAKFFAAQKLLITLPVSFTHTRFSYNPPRYVLAGPPMSIQRAMNLGRYVL